MFFPDFRLRPRVGASPSPPPQFCMHKNSHFSTTRETGSFLLLLFPSTKWKKSKKAKKKKWKMRKNKYKTGKAFLICPGMALRKTHKQNKTTQHSIFFFCRVLDSNIYIQYTHAYNMHLPLPPSYLCCWCFFLSLSCFQFQKMSRIGKNETVLS